MRPSEFSELQENAQELGLSALVSLATSAGVIKEARRVLISGSAGSKYEHRNRFSTTWYD
jgi:hypothetical protein